MYTEAEAALVASVPAMIAELAQPKMVAAAAQVKAVYRLIAAKEQIPADLRIACGVIEEKGDIRWSSRAGRFMLTETGTKFFRLIKRFG